MPHVRLPSRSRLAYATAVLLAVGLAACGDGAAKPPPDDDLLVTATPATPLDALHPLHAAARQRIVDRATFKGSATGILGGVAPLDPAQAVAKADLRTAANTVAKPTLAARDKVSTDRSSFVTTEGLQTTTIGTKSYADGSVGNGCVSGSSCATAKGTVTYSNARVWSADSQWLLVGNELRHRRYGFQWVEAKDPDDPSDPKDWSGTYHTYLSAFGTLRVWSRVQPATLFTLVRPQTQRQTYTAWTAAGWTLDSGTRVDHGSSQEEGTTTFLDPNPKGCATGASRLAFAGFWGVSCSAPNATSQATWTNLPATVLAAVNLVPLTHDAQDLSTYENLVTTGNASLQSPERTVNRLLYTQLRADTASGGYDFFEKHGCRRIHFPMAQEPYTTGAMELGTNGKYAPILKQTGTGTGKFLERLLLYCDRPANWNVPNSTDPDYSGWDAPAGDIDGSKTLDYRDVVQHNATRYYAGQHNNTALPITDWPGFFTTNASCGKDINCYLAKADVKKNRDIQFRQFADLTPYLESAKYEGDVLLDVRIASTLKAGGDDPTNYTISVKETNLLSAGNYTVGGQPLAVSAFPTDYVNKCTQATCFDRITVWSASVMPGGGWAMVAFQLLKQPGGGDDTDPDTDPDPNTGGFLIAFTRLDAPLAAPDTSTPSTSHDLPIATLNSHSSTTRVVSGGRYYDAYVSMHSNHSLTNGTEASVSAVLLPDDATETPKHNEVLPAADVDIATGLRLTGASLGGMASFTHLSCGAAVPSDWSQWCVLSADGTQSPYGDENRKHALNGFESGSFGEEEIIAVDVTGVVERSNISVIAPSGLVPQARSVFPFAGQIWNDRSNIAKLAWVRPAALSGQIYDLAPFANMSPDLTMVTWNSSWMPDDVVDISRATDLDEDKNGSREALSRCGENGAWKTPCPNPFSNTEAQQSSTATCTTGDPCIDSSDNAVLWSHQTFATSGLIACNDGNTLDGDGCSSVGWVEACAPESALCKNGAPIPCNDGNTLDGDGCASEGYVETKLAQACNDGNTLDGDGCESEGYKQACSDGNTVAGDGCSAAKLVEATGSPNVLWRCAMDGKSRCRLEVVVPFSGADFNVFDDVTESTAATPSDVVTIPSTVSCKVVTTSFTLFLHSDAIAGAAGSGCNDGSPTTECDTNLTGGAKYVKWGYDYFDPGTSKTYVQTAPSVGGTSVASFAGALRFGAAYAASVSKFPAELPRACTPYPDAADPTVTDPPLGVCQTLIDASKVYDPSLGWTQTVGTTKTTLLADPLKDKQLKSGTLKLWFSESYSGTLATDYQSAAVELANKQARFLFTCK